MYRIIFLWRMSYPLINRPNLMKRCCVDHIYVFVDTHLFYQEQGYFAEYMFKHYPYVIFHYRVLEVFLGKSVRQDKGWCWGGHWQVLGT